MQREIGALRIVHKENDAFSKLVDGLLRVVTFGQMSTYVSQYTTVMGKTIYVPAGWDERPDTERYVTLRHEAVHFRQMKRYGQIGMSLLYMLPIFPLGLAYGRARIEWEAYAETLRAIAEVNGIEAARHPKLRAHIVKQFTSAAYGWMWSFPAAVNAWIDSELARIALSASHPAK
jgi:hypothetical protein